MSLFFQPSGLQGNALTSAVSASGSLECWRYFVSTFNPVSPLKCSSAPAVCQDFALLEVVEAEGCDQSLCFPVEEGLRFDESPLFGVAAPLSSVTHGNVHTRRCLVSLRQAQKNRIRFSPKPIFSARSDCENRLLWRLIDRKKMRNVVISLPLAFRILLTLHDL